MGRVQRGWKRELVVEGAGYDLIGRGRDRSGGDIETNAQRRENGSEHNLGEQVEREMSSAVERDWKREIDFDCVGYDV